jgi:hypothetical protein
MNSVCVEGVYIGKAKNLGHGLVIDIDKQRLERRTWLWPQGLGCALHGDPRFPTSSERALYRSPAKRDGCWRLTVAWASTSFFTEPLEGLRA